LRFDAVHAIGDSPFLLEMAETIRAALPGRHIHLMLENEEHDPDLLCCGAAAQKYDGQWADVWHHCAHVLLTGESDGYYADFPDPAEQMAQFLATGLAGPPPTAIIYLQNHDQIGNRAFGERLRRLAHPAALRAAIALLLFTPQIPMIFMGEEFGETRPFLYFTDHHDELGRQVTAGRRQEFSRFAAFRAPDRQETIPEANAAATFQASIPQVTENDWTALYTDCLRLRRTRLMPLMDGCQPAGAAALSAHAVRAAWRMKDGSLLTVATNFAATPTPYDGMEGELLYGPGLEDGMLPGFTTCLWRA
jgi:maltooligosyltrehalose trehalohydrolase